MNQRYESRKEYSLMDVLQYNLRKWWLAAGFLGGFFISVMVACGCLCGSFCSDRRWIQGKNPDALY